MFKCTYDNPETFEREFWIDGLLVARYSFALKNGEGTKYDPRFWESGRIIGERQAMGKRDV